MADLLPKRPSGKGWRVVGTLPTATVWETRLRGQRLRVLSSLHPNALAPDGSGDLLLQWHVSVSCWKSSRRPDDAALRFVRHAFELLAAEEDNHHPGNARHLWMPVDPARRVGCECKADERTIVETDGYRWTTPVDGPCRGCSAEAITRRSCPIHGAEVAHV